jgi:UDP-N-acetylglucosamine--N-acetylmuramyl-(pentapeptide) pyrophosphoryl-undecaprenol N-acetylglucosamine transferase
VPSNDQSARLLLAAGGTGGHIYPGLAIAGEFQTRHPRAEIVFVGTARGLEERIIGGAGFEVHMLRAEPLRGGSLGRKIKGGLALFPAAADANKLLREFRPDAVVGVGGYISGPLLLMAALRRLPTLILEPNYDPGLTNKWLARFVDAAAVAWEDTAGHFRGKAFVSGNPVRPEIAAVPDIETSSKLRVLLFGGSQGSRILNDAMVAALPLLAADVEITHQTGAADLERVRAAYAEAGRQGRIEPYLPDMNQEYARCTIVVSRAGATTCAELAAAGRGAILVPLELAGGHQRHNAGALERAGAAIVMPEAELTGTHLATTLNKLATDPEKYVAMGSAARRQAKPDATTEIVDKIEALIAHT